MQRAGVTNHLVVALDEFTKRQVEKWGSVAVFVQLSGQEEQQALSTGSNHSVSGTPTQAICSSSGRHCCEYALKQKSTMTEFMKLFMKL